MRKVRIWPAAAMGELVAKQIKVYFKNWEVVDIIDKNEKLHGKPCLRYSIASPDVLKEAAEDDILVVAGIKWEEICEEAVNKYNVPKQNILVVQHYWPTAGLQIIPKVRWEMCGFMPYAGDNEFYQCILDEIKVSEGELNEIGLKYGTDKASVFMTPYGFRFAHDYLRHYDKLFRSLRKEKLQLCELGCGTGSSLKMWKEYFPKATIVGVDICQEAKRFEEERVEVVVGNAAHQSTIEELSAKYGEFDIIIDDASHAWGDMRMSFEMLWSSLKHGGTYVIEDTQCGSQGAFDEYPPAVWDSQHIVDYIMDRASIMKFPREWNPEFNRYHFEQYPAIIQKIESEIDSVIMIHGTCIITKR